MSERPIQVGDLCRVLRGCGCAPVSKVDGLFVVIDRLHEPVDWSCAACGKAWPCHAEFTTQQFGLLGCPISWLKRIPPLEELEGEQRKETLTA